MYLSGCQALATQAIAKLAGAGSNGIQSDIQVGDREIKTDLQAGDKSSQQIQGGVKAEQATITQQKSQNQVEAEKVTINDTNPWLIIFFFLAALLFWALPSPATLWAKFKTKLKQRRRV